MYQTYILRCTDQTLYTGITTDLTRRMRRTFFRQRKMCQIYPTSQTPKTRKSLGVGKQSASVKIRISY